MNEFGQYLKNLRLAADRSARWVERRSKALYPEQPESQISHSYLRQVEEGARGRPRRAKICSLARIYEVSESELLVRAGLEAQTEGRVDGTTAENASQLALAEAMIARLVERGLNPSYFMQGVTRLSDDALGIVSRLVSTLSVRQGVGDRVTSPSQDTEVP